MNDCLARLRVSHAWYDTRPITGLALSPDPQTAAILRRFDLWWRYQGSEWTLYSGRTGTAATLLAGLTCALEGGPLKLNFLGNLAHLASITALPDGLRTLPRFTSRIVDAAPDDNATDHILTPQTDDTMPLATVWLYPDDLTRAAPDATWHIRFDAAEMPWIYYVVNRSRGPLNRPFVRASDGSMLTGPVETRLPDGDTALRFDTGGRPLTFSRVPTMRFGLFDQFRSPLSEQTTEICLIRSLPLPAPGSVLHDLEGVGRRISAATTIYL